jgi:hypothetical protein
VKIETVSVGYKLALSAYSQQQAFRLFQCLPCTNPLSQDLGSLVPNDMSGMGGVLHKAGWPGELSQNRLKVTPFADQPQANFSVRVWGYRECQAVGQSGNSLPVWVPEFLAEFACVSSQFQGVANPGPEGTLNPYVLPDTAYLCDTMTLTQGDLGASGRLNSTGPGTNLPAYAVLDFFGTRFLGLDFQQTDQVGMNAIGVFC